MSDSDPKTRKPQEMFVLTPEVLGQLIAAETSGIESAKPEQEDIQLAKDFIRLINSRYDYTERRHIAWVPN